MKRTKVKIAVLVGAVVMVTLLLFLLIFNLVMRRQIRSESETALSKTAPEPRRCPCPQTRASPK